MLKKGRRSPLGLEWTTAQSSVSVAGEAGDSSCCSSHALHNEILERRPDLHKVYILATHAEQ